MTREGLLGQAEGAEKRGGNDRGPEDVDDNYRQVRSDTGMDGEM